MSSRAAIQKAYRRRSKAVRCVLCVEVDEVNVAEALASHGLLAAGQRDDRKAMAAAAARLLELLPRIPIAVTGNAAPSAPVLCRGGDDRESGD